jgi:hypothetical protein
MDQTFCIEQAQVSASEPNKCKWISIFFWSMKCHNISDTGCLIWYCTGFSFMLQLGIAGVIEFLGFVHHLLFWKNMFLSCGERMGSHLLSRVW